MEQLGSHLDGVSWNLIFEYLSKNLSREFKFAENVTRITGALGEDQYKFIMRPWIILRIRNVSDKSCREHQNTYFTLNIPPPRKSCCFRDYNIPLQSQDGTAIPSWLCLETVIRNLHETYQCRMYSKELLMMGREDAWNMESFMTEWIWLI